MSQAVTVRPLAEILSWPPEGFSRVPLHVHSDPEIYAWEQDLIFRGPAWHFLGLEVEIPKAGDFITSFIGDTPVIVIRTEAGTINGLVNRCAHKGTTVCYEQHGNKPVLTCPYHNWIYDHDGNLTTVAFERGLKGAGGMPDDFDKAKHGLPRLRVRMPERADVRQLLGGDAAARRLSRPVDDRVHPPHHLEADAHPRPLQPGDGQ